MHREVRPAVPPKTEYSPTEGGATLGPVVQAICDWGEEHLSDRIM